MKSIKQMNLKELTATQGRVTRAIKRKKEQLVRAQTRAAKIARACGVSIRQLIVRADKGVPRKPKILKAKVIRVAKPKFANPKNATQTWSGKGRPPLWYKAAIKANAAVRPTIN